MLTSGDDTVKANSLNEKLQMNSTSEGAVLGVDVGWNPHKPTTGLCLLVCDQQTIWFKHCEVGAEEGKRLEAINALVRGETLRAVAFDGPLAPDLKIWSSYRAGEALLSRGKFQKRGKPGATNSGGGAKLHYHATKLARLVLDTQNVLPAKYPCKIHGSAILEAFPNLFLAFLLPESHFQRKHERKRVWTDLLFPYTRPKLQQMISGVAHNRELGFPMKEVQGHDVIAAFVCAVTALCVSMNRYVAVGDKRSGYIFLPPLEYWGESS